MKRETRNWQIEKMIFTAINNLFAPQGELNFAKRTLVTLGSSISLERNSILKKTIRTLSSNGMQINSPRSINGHFGPLIIDLTKQAQVNKLVLLLCRKANFSREVSYILKDFLENLYCIK